MIGTQYQAHGITLHRGYAGGGHGWAATVRFRDAGFCNDDADLHHVSTEGELRTRYFVTSGDQVTSAIAAATVIRADAERLGIVFTDPLGDSPAVYLHPDNWIADDIERGNPEIQAVIERVATALGGWNTTGGHDVVAADPAVITAPPAKRYSAVLRDLVPDSMPLWESAEFPTTGNALAAARSRIDLVQPGDRIVPTGDNEYAVRAEGVDGLHVADLSIVETSTGEESPQRPGRPGKSSAR